MVEGEQVKLPINREVKPSALSRNETPQSPKLMKPTLRHIKAR